MHLHLVQQFYLILEIILLTNTYLQILHIFEKSNSLFLKVGEFSKEANFSYKFCMLEIQKFQT